MVDLQHSGGTIFSLCVALTGQVTLDDTEALLELSEATTRATPLTVEFGSPRLPVVPPPISAFYCDSPPPSQFFPPPLSSEYPVIPYDRKTLHFCKQGEDRGCFSSPLGLPFFRENFLGANKEG